MKLPYRLLQLILVTIMGLTSLTSASSLEAAQIVLDQPGIASTPTPKTPTIKAQHNSATKAFQPDYGQALVRFLGLFGALAGGMWMNRRINQRRKS